MRLRAMQFGPPVLLALLIPILLFAFSGGPPDAHTAGFGEPSCTQCHGTAANTNGGSVMVQSPDSYTSGTTYTIVVTISDATARRWGFQLSARTIDGKQAGTLTPGSDGFTQIASAAVSGPLANPSVQYIEHTSVGNRSGLSGPVGFTFNWTAPEVSRGAVIFNVAANAANNNFTNDPGDHIYTTQATVQPQAPPPPPPSTGGAATLVVNPTVLTFHAVQGGANPATQTISVSQSSAGPFSWSALVTSGSWIGVSPSSGSGAGSASVSANIAGLAAGTHSGSMQVVASGLVGSPANIVVQLNISAPPIVASPAPSLAITPRSLAFSSFAGARAAEPQSLGISNSGGGGAITWTAAISSVNGGNWLRLSPTSGSTPGSLGISVSLTGLTPRLYDAVIRVQGVLAANPSVSVAPQFIPVTLNLTAAPEIQLSTSALVFAGLANGASPPSQTINVSNAGGSVLNWTAAAVKGPWLRVSPISGKDTGVLIVSVDLAGLEPGTHDGTLQVAASGAAPRTISVTLTVASPGAAAISLKPTMLLFHTATGTSPSPQTVQVQNTGSGALHWAASASTQSGGNWLSVTPGTAVAPSSITVTVNASGLLAGVYSGMITVVAVPSEQANNSPQTVIVHLAVGGPVVDKVVGGASFTEPVAPGSSASIFGGGFISSSGDTSIQLDGVNAPLFFASWQQANFQVPWELSGQSQAALTIASGGGKSASVPVKLAPFAPAILTTDSTGAGQGAIVIANTGQLAAPAGSAGRPANRGEFVTIYCTGLGPVTNQPATGAKASAILLSNTIAVPSVIIAGVWAPLTDGFFSGLTPAYVGLYQVNVRVPEEAPRGAEVPVSIMIGGAGSNIVTMAVQ